MENRDTNGQFIKGHISFISEKTKEKISAGVKKNLPTTAFKKGCVSWNKKLYPKIPDLCSCGCNNIVWGGHQYKNGHNMRGVHLPEEIKNKLRESRKSKFPRIPILCACGCNEIVWGGKCCVHGHNKPWVGKKHKPETIIKFSKAKIGCVSWMKGKTHSKQAREKISNAGRGKRMGAAHPRWVGGTKISRARKHAKEKLKGFILISLKNPYDEPIEYHHIYPGLPYVVPCPRRIHQMFGGKNHFQNVNAMLGIKIQP